MKSKKSSFSEGPGTGASGSHEEGGRRPSLTGLTAAKAAAKSLSFKAKGHGGHGRNHGQVELDTLDPVTVGDYVILQGGGGYLSGSYATRRAGLQLDTVRASSDNILFYSIHATF